MFDFSARYGIEFDNNGNKQIYIAKASAPYDGESFGVVFDSSDREDEIFSSTELPTDNSADNEFMWTLTHCTTMNNTDIVEYIGENGLWFYHTTINLAAGEKFSLKNFTTNELIGADYLVDITGDIAAVTREGDLVSVTNSGSFYIIYLPAFNSFTIDCDTSSSSSEINMYLDGEFISLTKEGEVVTYTNLEATTSTNIAFVNGTFTVYYPIAIDSQTDSAIAHVVESSGMSLLYFDKAGTYNLAYNVETGVLSIASVGGGNEQGGGDESGSIDDYIFFISVMDDTNGDQTLYPTKNPDNPNEVYVRVETIAANSYLSVSAMSKADYSSTTYGTLADTDTSVATNLTADTVCVKVAGPIDIYFSFETKTIRIVAVS